MSIELKLKKTSLRECFTYQYSIVCGFMALLPHCLDSLVKETEYCITICFLKILPIDHSQGQNEGGRVLLPSSPTGELKPADGAHREQVSRAQLLHGSPTSFPGFLVVVCSFQSLKVQC